MLGIADFGVHRPWRRLGIARLLHDALLQDRPEPHFASSIRTDTRMVYGCSTRCGKRREAGWRLNRF